ncbi:hypothetical protein GPECTOR_54g226 [Gonium pectorale]|uniref:Endonuclease/exonuclease/phosphatase domain-containing protein n=1 Tax=Gonium pectorale TaxID=33097 RepID=A0A150G7G4_GONPE|nr:hypothetical protein GPECTOR_54g226 [Gonium pectorale]|eukprot:KXZ45485.1 hypothetical protein GPECTOR_54g226 [Gonium pectorale]
MNEIKAYDADVVCLQEVDGSSYLRLLGPLARAAGYKTIYLPRGDRRPAGPEFRGYWRPGPFGPRSPPVEGDGTLLLYRASRLRLRGRASAVYRDLAPEPEEQSVYEAELFWRRAATGNNVLVALFELRDHPTAAAGGGASASGSDGGGSDAGGSSCSSDGEGVEREGGPEGGGGEAAGGAQLYTGRRDEEEGGAGAREGPEELITEDEATVEEEEEEEEEETGGWGLDAGVSPTAGVGWDSPALDFLSQSGRPAAAAATDPAAGTSGAAAAARRRSVAEDTAEVDAEAGEKTGARRRRVALLGVSADGRTGTGDGSGVRGAGARRGGGGARRPNGRVFCVVNAHLWWDPSLPDQKVAEAHLLCRAATRFLRRRGFADPTEVPLVLCGDFNSTPARFRTERTDRVAPGGCLVSGVYELLTRGSLGSEHPHHPSSLGRPSEDPARLRKLRFDTDGYLFASSYAAANGRDPPATIRTAGFRGCLDYVWVSRGHWALSATLDMPYRYGNDPYTDELDKDAVRQREDAAAAPASVAAPVGAASGGSGLRAAGVGAASGGTGAGVPAAAPPTAAEAAMAATSLDLGMAGRGPVWELPPQPNAEWPSDHIAVGAELILLPPQASAGP